MTKNTSANLNPDEELPDGQTSEHPWGSARDAGHTPYQAAVASIFADHRAQARLSVVKAVHIDAARLEHAAEFPADRSSGGPKWTSEVVAQRELVTELSAGLRISENSARILLFISRGLVEEFPTTRAALGSGAISYRHAQKVVEPGPPSIPPSRRR